MTRRSLTCLFVSVALLASPALLAKEPQHQEFKVALPGKDWSLVLDLPGYRLDEESTRPDGTGAMLQASRKKTKLVVSVFIERNPEYESALACKDDYWSKAVASPFPKSDVRVEETDAMVAVHWFVPSYGGVAIKQQNTNAYLYRDGTCIDVHISKVYYKPADAPLFKAALDSVHFVETPVSK